MQIPAQERVPWLPVLYSVRGGTQSPASCSASETSAQADMPRKSIHEKFCTFHRSPVRHSRLCGHPRGTQKRATGRCASNRKARAGRRRHLPARPNLAGDRRVTSATLTAPTRLRPAEVTTEANNSRRYWNRRVLRGQALSATNGKSPTSRPATTSTDPAGTLGIDVPDRLLALADEVIE